MKEDLITFDTAKLAKEKGFDWECNNWWVETLEHKLDIPRSGVEHFPSHEPRILGHKPSGNHHIIHASAPTQSLLQKWLRDNYNIMIVIGHHIDYDNPNKVWKNKKDILYELFVNYYGENFEIPCTDYDDYYQSHITTYEEALEIGLQEALKLI